LHDIKDIRRDPEKYRESQRKRGLESGVIDELLLVDGELRALKTVKQECQSRLNKLSEEYGRAKRRGATELELFVIEFDIALVNLDLLIALTDVQIKYMEEREYAMLGGREIFEEICNEIEATREIPEI
jgi:hypothetical protein